MFFYQSAKNSPLLITDRQKAFERAKKLDNGISISWLDETWTSNMLSRDGVTDADMKLLKQLGFKTIRLPVAFEYFETQKVPAEQVYTRIDRVVKLCHNYGFSLIIVYHYGRIDDQNYVSATNQAINTWLALTKRYLKNSYNALFFEIYNEPPAMNPQTWKDAAYNMVTAIRKVDKERTLLVGASNYNSIYELSRFVRLPDENIIYAFHFYEPFLFTHQGAAWVGDQVATIGVPFPYNEKNFPQLNFKTKGTDGELNYNKYHLDGNEGSVHDKLQIIKNWGNKYQVPLICSEYGSHNVADLDSRCRYLRCMRSNLKALSIPGVLWNYNTNFSIFNKEQPAMDNLPDCMKDALQYSGK